MEIIKLSPTYKDYLWGGRKLIDHYNKQSDLDIVAETWELSNHKDGSSTIINGEYEGYLFKDYLEIKGKSIWGTKSQKYDKFPIMIKFIDAKQALSIQVHPDDEYAHANEGEYGKNEFWYVLEAEPGAFLYYGVKDTLTKEQFRKYIENGTICDHLRKVAVKQGDCFFIETGTIHAIGSGIVIAEIQQCSNSTYRVFDFNRVGADGQLRDLHIDKAVEVSNLIPNASNGHPQGNLESFDGYNCRLLSQNDYFTCLKYDVEGRVELETNTSSFQALTVIEGAGNLFYDNDELRLTKGDSIFVPAQKGEFTITGKVSFILTSL